MLITSRGEDRLRERRRQKVGLQAERHQGDAEFPALGEHEACLPGAGRRRSADACQGGDDRSPWRSAVRAPEA